MPLDLAQIVAQIKGMTAMLRVREPEKQERLRSALDIFHSQAAEFDSLKPRIESSKTTWLVAGLGGKIDLHQSPPVCPQDFIVLASDGSHIDVDRHRSTRCFVINIGLVRLQYGQTPDAQLSSFPSLYFEDEEVTISAPAEGTRQEIIEGQLLAAKRSVEECRQLAKLAGELEGNLPVVALVDGSLILWGLAGQTYPDFVVRALLDNSFLKHLDEIRRLSQKRQLAVASFISFPRSTDVVNVLRLAVCPYQPVDCDRHCASGFQQRECDIVAGVLDRDLFNRFLAPGERSAIFTSRSSVVARHYGVHQVNFFYIKVDEEVARVEVPRWVVEDGKLVELVHAVVLDQCRRGQGYPVALSEAHEKAVVTTADREQFWQLVEHSLAEERLLLRSSAKSKSKRTRWI